jgi:hypothetical protein
MVKEIYDRILPEVELDADDIPDPLTFPPDTGQDNHVGRKKKSYTAGEGTTTSSTNAPNPKIESWPAHGGGQAPVGSNETAVYHGPAASPAAAVEDGIGGNSRVITDDAGNSININNDGSITLQHKTGASFSIAPDGAIHLTAAGDKGINLDSGSGGFNFSSKGKMVFDSSAGITFSAGGPVGIHAKGAFPISLETGGDMIISAGGSVNQNISGTHYSWIGGSKSEMVYGNGDYQVKGLMKLGSTSEINMDSPKTHIGASEKLTLNSEGTLVTTSVKSTSITSQGKILAMAKADFFAASMANFIAIGNQSASLESQLTTNVRGDNINLEATAGIAIDSDGYLFARAQTLAASAASTLAIKAGTNLKLSSMGSLDIDADGAINIAGATIDLNSRAKDPTEPDDPMVSTAANISKVKKIDDIYPTEKLSADNWTSKEAFDGMNKNLKPMQEGFPYSDNALSGDDYGAMQNDGNQLPSGAQQNADQKPAGGSQVTDGESYGPIDLSTSENYTPAYEPDPATAPSSSNPADSVGFASLEGVPGVEDIPGDGQCSTGRDIIYKNMMHLNENIAIPLIKKFSDVTIERAFIKKYNDNCSNPHFKGLAFDFGISQKNNYPKLMAVAMWAARRLPCSVVRIEKTLTHSYIHIEAAEAGKTGQNCTVETCNDKEGTSKTSGLVLKTNEIKEVKLSARAQDNRKKPTWLES